MEVRSIDGVTFKKKQPQGVRISVHVVREIGVLTIPNKQRPHPRSIIPKARGLHRFSMGAVAAFIIVSFSAGLWVMWNTHALHADTEVPSSEVPQTPPGAVSLQVEDSAAAPMSTPVSDQGLYTMTLEQLEYYLQEGYKTPEMREQERVLARTEKLRAYLQSKKSPLADIADTLAGLQHWRVVIAISNSESSLGKRCVDNNCSGIGVEPGHPLWREYETKADWAKDLDALIEKRYKNWSLEEMNGVYNNPGSENWVFAASQILNDLKEVE